MKNPRPAIWMLIAIVAAACVSYYTLGMMITHADQCLHNMGGDGGKNYYTYLQHALYGKGMWFTGMNYPYGEHIMFVDAQPALSVTLGFLRKYITLTPGSATAILNLLMAFAFAVAILVVYKILLRFKVAHFWAIIFACCIICTCTQNTRMFGLYGLSYACIIPLIFYWSVNYYDSGRIRYMVYLLLLSCIAMFLHPYHLATALVWSSLYILGYIIVKKQPGKAKLMHLLPVVGVIMVSLLVFKLVSSSTDPVTDRTSYPHGLLSYGVTGDDIFKSPHSPIWLYMQDKGIIKPMPFEESGYPYLGIAPALILCLFVLVFTYKWLRKKRGDDAYKLYGLSPIWIFIAFLALLYSMGVPFVWGLEGLYDYIASFRQFRSLGWFGLIFYYVATIFSAVIMYNILTRYSSAKRYMVVGILFFLPLTLWVFEGYAIASKFREQTYIAPYNYDFFHGKLEQTWPDLLSEKGYNATDFQAVIQMPFYYVGSEKIWLQASNWGMALATKAAYQLALPLVNANMSRSSWSQTFKQVKIAGGPYTFKPLLDDVKDKRPYLLCYFEYDKLNPDEQYLFSLADSIGKTSNLIAYALYPEKLRRADSAAKEKIRTIAAGMATGDTSFHASPLFYNHFDNGDTTSFFGEGSSKAMLHTDSLLVNIDIDDKKRSGLIECSAWFLVNDVKYTTPSLRINMFDSAWQEILMDYIPSNAATDVWPMWFRAGKYFAIPQNCHHLQLYLMREKEGVYYAIDELLVRQAADTIVSKDAHGRIMVNNHLISR